MRAASTAGATDAGFQRAYRFMPRGVCSAHTSRLAYPRHRPSFRTNEVNWDAVRVLPNGEVVSTTGTHLGHNLPDHTGNRFCINLVSIAGKPKE